MLVGEGVELADGSRFEIGKSGPIGLQPINLIHIFLYNFQKLTSGRID